MRFSFTRNLPKSEIYIASKKDIKAIFGHFELLDVNFGLRTKFKIDSRCLNNPRINGPVVASIFVNRTREIVVSFYPVSLSVLPTTVLTEFQENTLQNIRKWIDGVIGKPETAIVGVEQLIVELVGNSFKFHQVTFL
jgi:hypothetical protein